MSSIEQLRQQIQDIKAKVGRYDCDDEKALALLGYSRLELIKDNLQIKQTLEDLLDLTVALSVSAESYGCHLAGCRAVTDMFSDECTCGWEDHTFDLESEDVVAEARKLIACRESPGTGILELHSED